MLPLATLKLLAVYRSHHTYNFRRAEPNQKLMALQYGRRSACKFTRSINGHLQSFQKYINTPPPHSASKSGLKNLDSTENARDGFYVYKSIEKFKILKNQNLHDLASRISRARYPPWLVAFNRRFTAFAYLVITQHQNIIDVQII